MKITLLFCIGTFSFLHAEVPMTLWNALTPDEAKVIVSKGTEKPFTGEYTAHHDKGIYICRRCEAALYRSSDKFNSGCGWPAFDDAVPGAVVETLDADGQRIEITCASCGAHLGHIFKGERMTRKNTRHCVNSISMRFTPEADVQKKFARATFAGGCFWGVEYYLQQAKGVISATSGYCGGTKENPTYKEVCSKTTGHYEAVEVVYDPKQTSFETLTKLFFEIHDPTQADGQGPDLGPQYRSAIFCGSEAEKATAQKLIAQLESKGYRVVTQLLPSSRFWPAESLHQDYYFYKGKTPYCHRPVKRFDESSK